MKKRPTTDTQSLSERLPANQRNPRRITKRQADVLKAALLEFGDLSGIVFNSKTKRLVGGHQRVQAFNAEQSDVVIEKRYDKATKNGTVAEGYVVVNGERFCYREVAWNKQKETAAMIAANQHGGEFEMEGLSELVKELSSGSLDINLLGFEPNEVTKMLTNKGATLAKLNVTIEEPKHSVERGDVWHAGDHRIACLDVFTDWPRWTKLLKPEALFLPYAGPLVLLGDKAKQKVFIIVNPDPYLCGHILDKWAEATGKKPRKET